jgi:hypothetical protein
LARVDTESLLPLKQIILKEFNPPHHRQASCGG